MSEKVLSSIARNYENIRKGVEAVMGGQVLDYEAKRILNEGRNEGRKEGRREGRKEGRREGRREGRKKGREEGLEKGIEKGMLNTLASLAEDGILSFEEAAMRAGLSESKFREKLTELTE